jgi:hypothetical protein
MLDLAAYCGHPAARSAVGRTDDPLTDMWIYRWGEGLEPWGPVAQARAAVAAVRHALPIWERERPEDLRPHQAIDAAERWIMDPSEANALQAIEAHARADHASEPPRGRPSDDIAWAAAQCAAVPVLGLRVACDAMHIVDEILDVKEAIAREVCAWALGEDDPVRRRVTGG